MNAELVKLMGPQLEVVLPELDETARRLVLGAEARAAGARRDRRGRRAAGRPWRRSRAAAELESGAGAAPGRARRPGGGPQQLAETDPGLVPALLALVEPDERGDPVSPLRWTAKSRAHAGRGADPQGHRCSADTVRRLLRGQGFSLQANTKTIEGRQHPDRDAQFRYISEQAREHLAAGQPVISVDTKKKEQVGRVRPTRGGSGGREGDPVQVRDHRLPRPRGGQGHPVRDLRPGRGRGLGQRGIDHDTSAFAVESIRRWWHARGRGRLPGRGGGC